MADESGSIYPQKITGEIGGRIESKDDLKGPQFFKCGNNTMFMRPSNLIKSGFDGRKLFILCQTQGYLNRIVQTHETEMFQFSKS